MCQDPSDPLRLILNDLGPVPTLQELMGTAAHASPILLNPVMSMPGQLLDPISVGFFSSYSGETAADPGAESSKTEVSLTLTNKFDIFNDSEDKPDARGLLLR